MQKILEYEIGVRSLFTISMPKGAEILSVMNRRELVTLCAIVDETAEKEKRLFDLVATLGEITYRSRKKFIGTVQLNGGARVFHLFEILDPSANC